MILTFGIECEVEYGGGNLAIALHDAGAKQDDKVHRYHCSCAGCSYDRDSPWTVQDDCSCGGEAISKVLKWNVGVGPDDEAAAAIATLGKAMRTARTSPGRSAGNHVHVGHNFLPRYDNGLVNDNLLVRLFFRYQNEELNAVAGARDKVVRSYNAPLTTRWLTEDMREHFWDGTGRYAPEGRWLARRERTHEFRLWNSTRMEWRLHLHAGLSVAMMAAAVDGVEVVKNDTRSLTDVIGPYLDGRTADYLKKQLAHAGYPA